MKTNDDIHGIYLFVSCIVLYWAPSCAFFFVFFHSDQFFWSLKGLTATVMLCPGHRTFLPTGKLHRTSAQATCSMFHLPRIWWQAMKQAKWDECMCLALMLLCVQEHSGWQGNLLALAWSKCFFEVFFFPSSFDIKILLALITHSISGQWQRGWVGLHGCTDIYQSHDCG